MPCWIRLLRRLGIPISEEDRELERELRFELRAHSHEELYGRLVEMEMYEPERLEELVERIRRRLRPRRARAEAMVA